MAGGEFPLGGIPEGIYELKVTNGRVFENAPRDDIPEDSVQGDPSQYKPLRTFAEAKVGVAVQVNDVVGLSVTLTETKVPEVVVDQDGEQYHMILK